MKRAAILTGGGLALIALWLALRNHAQSVVYAKPTEVPSIPKVVYIVDEPKLAPEPVTPQHGVAFDWLGKGDCGCVTTRGTDTLIIDSISIEPRQQPGYYPVAPLPPLPPYIKGALPIYMNPTMPDIPSYRAPPPTFWWGWIGLTRVIYTSDGATLRTGLENSLWFIWNGSGRTNGQKDNWVFFDPITTIKYNGQLYQLDSKRSVGL